MQLYYFGSSVKTRNAPSVMLLLLAHIHETEVSAATLYHRAVRGRCWLALTLLPIHPNMTTLHLGLWHCKLVSSVVC